MRYNVYNATCSTYPAQPLQRNFCDRTSAVQPLRRILFVATWGATYALQPLERKFSGASYAVQPLRRNLFAATYVLAIWLSFTLLNLHFRGLENWKRI